MESNEIRDEGAAALSIFVPQSTSLAFLFLQVLGKTNEEKKIETEIQKKIIERRKGMKEKKRRKEKRKREKGRTRRRRR